MPVRLSFSFISKKPKKRTESNPNKKKSEKNRAKPEKTEPKPEKTESNRKNRAKPV
jgi:hypothetical protein